jgi:amino acid adenylation domain-containing protein
MYLGNYTGANKINRQLVEQMARRGHEVRVIAVSSPLMAGAPIKDESAIVVSRTTETSKIVEIAGVEVHIVDVANLGELPKLRSYLLAQIEAFDPTWILVSSEDWGQFVLEASVKAAPERVVYLAHTGMALPFGPDALMPNPAATKLMAKAAGIIAVSRYLSEYITEWSGIPAVHRYIPGYGDGPFPVFGSFDHGYVTMVNPCTVKGIDIFLGLARALPEIEFAAIPTWGTNDQDFAAMNAQPNITLLPRTEHIDEFFAQTRVFLVPSLWHEAFGLIVVEAMLRGIPVLASDVGGIPEAKLGTDYVLPVRPITKYGLDDSLTIGQDVPEQDLAPWIAALQTLLSDRDLYQRQSAAAREAALKFVESLGINAYEDFLNELMGQREQRIAQAAQTQEVTQRIDQLSAKKRALLELMRKEKAAAKKQIMPIDRSSSALPLSFAQQRQWVIDQFEPGSPLYNIPTAMRLRGPLSVPALQQAFSTLVARHESLRTTFPRIDGQPVQQIHPPAPVELPVVDLSMLPADERAAQTEQHLVAAAQQPFDLQRGPLLRLLLLRVAPDEQILLLTLHHIIADGWSLDVIMREFGALYAAELAQQPAALPPLPIQYADYAAWQRQWLQGETLDRQLDYWTNQLQDAPPFLELPTDRPRPPVQTFRGAIEEWLLTAELTQALQAWTQREGVTLFMTLLAAWQVVLYRWSGQSDIVVGTPIANRTRRELEGLIGFFANTLVLRTQLAPDLSVRELLQRVRETSLNAYAHQDVPFEMLVERLRPERSLSHTPFFQVIFALQNTSNQPYALSDLQISPVSVGSSTAKFDLTMAILEDNGKLIASLEYNTDLFDGETIWRLLSSYATVLSSMVADATQTVTGLPLLTESQREQIVYGFNDTQRPYPHDQCVHELVEAQAIRTPDAIAVVVGDQTLTYAQLNSRANQLAHALHGWGVSPGQFVAVCLERTPDLIVALLAILKAGAAYVPLDSTYPAERLQFMLQDTQASLLLTQESLRSLAPAAPRVVCLDTEWSAIAQQPTTNLPNHATPDFLAYVIYTSGSTGMPKGVMTPHRGITRLLFGVDYVRLDATETLLQMAPVSFDASTLEIWGALLHGARCVLFPERIPTPADIGQAIREFGVSTLWLTASLFNMVIDEAPQALTGARQLLIGGEALSVNHVRRALELLPDTQIINGYGPTESTTFTCCYPIPRPLAEPITSIPIGKPIANTTVYVLDSALQPVPVGAPGELYIGGAGLAWGYLNRPDLTADRFIPNPYAADSDSGASASSRLYKTGDLVRHRPDGSVEYLGRRDHQVKIRGFRIELGEIEAALAKHPAVQSAVVLAREDAPGDKRLVAYIVPDPEAAAEDLTAELRQSLQSQMPAYMVPSAMVMLDVLPLTPNGKLDRAALPAPDVIRDEATLVAPRTPIEEQLAALWQELLGIEQLGVHDNFFELGGHSILATQLMTRINDVFAVEIPLRQLFEQPTIEALALVIVQSLAEQGDDDQLSDLLAQLELLEQPEVTT